MCSMRIRTNSPVGCVGEGDDALATVCRPDFIIAGKTPATALDVVVQKDVLAMIREIQREIGSSLLFVTHDLAVHANLCHRLGVMYAGRLVEEGATAELLRTPRHPCAHRREPAAPVVFAEGETCPVPRWSADPPVAAASIRCPLASWTTSTCKKPPMRTVALTVASPATPRSQ